MFNILPISSDEVFELRCNLVHRGLLTLTTLYNFWYYTPPQILYPIKLQGSIYWHVLTSRVENSVNPDQLASEKPADLDLHCFQTRILCV